MFALRRLSQIAKHVQRFSTSASAVKLAYEHFPGSSSLPALVMVHGLLSNWRSIAKNLSRTMQRDVYTLDLRNHGESPHLKSVTYTDMAQDIAGFVQEHQLKDIVLLGHSLGGKVAMSFALDPTKRDMLSKLIVVDISAAKGPIGTAFPTYIKGMREITKQIDAGHLKSKKEADVILQKYESSMSTRQFLLTNLVPKSHSDSTLHWRVAVDYLEDGLDEIGKFPYEEGEQIFNKPALFIKGERSKYLNRKSIAITQKYFPDLVLETLPTDHWVHAEAPAEFQELVIKFCES